ncbi:hypothetical protein [Acetobacter sp. LMG 32666]|uniref:hypothetical protein n=1 Tax=Acetobacter sp. LMG 32666 TaxID=2959295 RepID=UPI0030C820AB
MDLLIAANTVTQAQADTAPASGTPGWATDGNPATGLLATDAPAWHYNMMMAELIAIIKAAGITPSNADWSQVLKAMQTIFAPAQYGVAPYSASLAQLIGGYPLGAIAFDASGNYWQSTKANNLTVPGAENANWVNFFAGVMTEEQADLRYLLLAGGNVKGEMDWGDKTTAGTTTHRFWAAGAPAEGDATPDATLTISGGTPGTANKGSVALAVMELDLSGAEQVLAPDPNDFASQQVLSARIAEGRYIRSVPADSGTNVRVVDVQEDADGNLIATMQDGTTQSYAPGSTGVIPATSALGAVYWTRQGNILTQSFQIIAAHSQMYQAFPFAYKAGTVPSVTAAAGATPNGYAAQLQVATPQTPANSGTTNVGILLDLPCWSGGGASAHVVASEPVALNLTVIGEAQ